MPLDPHASKPSYLRRLPEQRYRGMSIVHWSMALQGRATGWLSEGLHQRFREILLHGCALHAVSVPVYCLMPDHLHILVQGLSKLSDQRLWARHFRKHFSEELKHRSGVTLQDQAYDHVLRQPDDGPDSLLEVAGYIRQNPVRTNLVAEAENYPFTKCLVPGYPDLALSMPDYWLRYARVLTYLRRRLGQMQTGESGAGE